mmetsp:Transcript_25842/g.49507  ORF Transcript_25842/g.49507 Transcript_25842/m.49507 type:complete len:153 (+) Transcript_25842:73-531(+)
MCLPDKDQHDLSTSSADVTPVWNGVAPGESGKAKVGKAAHLEQPARLAPLASVHSGKGGWEEAAPLAKAAPAAAPAATAAPTAPAPRPKNKAAPPTLRLSCLPSPQPIIQLDTCTRRLMWRQTRLAGQLRSCPCHVTRSSARSLQNMVQDIV